MRLAMEAYAEDGVLAGSVSGKRAFADMVSRTDVPAQPTVCFLDFKGVAVLTTSFARDGVLAYRTHARAMWPSLYPVAANLAPMVREELQTWLVETGDVWVACDLADDGTPDNVSLLGQIDGKQSVALQGVIALGETDAAALAKHRPEEVASTAWNNRLVALSEKGLVIETTTGSRNKRYKPVLEGLSHGS